MIDMTRPVEGFDESTYLKMNPDVLLAVQRGEFPSGWQHFVVFGQEENRPGISSAVREKVTTVLKTVEQDGPGPAPPAHLRKRVHGADELAGFEQIGRTVASNIRDTIALASIELGENSRILDFGCGCGRVVRHLHGCCKKSQFYGTDIDEEAIAWCDQNLRSIGQFVVNGHHPPLPFADGFFDFVYGISVFTHLPEDMQFEWLEELRRVTKKGGYLLLTTHGEHLFASQSSEEREKFRDTGFCYLVGTGTEGLPTFYQGTYHAEEYIRGHWNRFFEITRIIPKGLVEHQDIVLCRKMDVMPDTDPD